MDSKIIAPIKDAASKMLLMMAQLEIQAAEPVVKERGANASGCVSGIMSMDGKNMKGSIALSFSFPLIQELVKRMLRTDIVSVDAMATDLAGELSNIVVGCAKSRLQDEGYDIDMSLPTVVSGEGHKITHSVDAPVVVLPFSTDCGEFEVEMCFAG